MEIKYSRVIIIFTVGATAEGQKKTEGGAAAAGGAASTVKSPNIFNSNERMRY